MPASGKKSKFKYLLLALTLMFLVHAFISDNIYEVNLFDVTRTIIFLVAVYAISRKRIHRIIAICFAIPCLILTWADYVVTTGAEDVFGHAFYTVFYAYTAGIVLMAVLHDDRVTLDTICGAACVYLLIGVLFGHVYMIVLGLNDQAINFTQEAAELAAGVKVQGRDFDLFYFSFTTLTSLGIGDILPITRPAKGIAALEVILGQLFIAVLLARLVGLHIEHSRRPAT